MIAPMNTPIFPINFNVFDKFNEKTNNIEATLLLSKLKFHHQNSKITSEGRTWLIRSREQISSWFEFSTKKTDSLLKHLESLGLIKKKVGLWFGKKALFISVKKDLEFSPINFKILKVFTDMTGSIKSAMLFAKILFSFNASKIEFKQKKWCAITKEILSCWAKVSIRTIDKLLEGLIKKGLIIKNLLVWRNISKSHFHIPNFVISLICDNFRKNKLENTKEPIQPCSLNCRQQPAKKGISIKIRKNLKKANNKTYLKALSTSAESDINFDSIKKTLTYRQKKYLEGAIKRTINQFELKVSNPKELFEELKFSILNIKQHKYIDSFKHVVSRCMKILADKNWKTPIGFQNHSKSGAEIKRQRNKKEEEWLKTKFNKTDDISKNIISFMKNTEKNSFNEMTEKAMHKARYLKSLISDASKKEASPKIMLEIFCDFTRTINGYIRQGANKKVLSEYIENNIFHYLKNN